MLPSVLAAEAVMHMQVTPNLAAMARIRLRQALASMKMAKSTESQLTSVKQILATVLFQVAVLKIVTKLSPGTDHTWTF
jgi:hypothetical protein